MGPRKWQPNIKKRLPSQLQKPIICHWPSLLSKISICKHNLICLTDFSCLGYLFMLSFSVSDSCWASNRVRIWTLASHWLSRLPGMQRYLQWLQQRGKSARGKIVFGFSWVWSLACRITMISGRTLEIVCFSQKMRMITFSLDFSKSLERADSAWDR